MTFIVPPNFDCHLDRTKRAIDALIQRNVISSFGSAELKIWLKNFDSDLDLYLASQLLDSLIIRSSKMLESMCHNAIEHTVMGLLREKCLWCEGQYDSTLRRIANGDTTLPFRFVVIEDFGEKPAKSGSELFRFYSRSNAIHKDLGIQPKRIPKQPTHVKFLILLDDFSGTGTQFGKFYNEFKLANHLDRYKFVFVPLMAHKDACKKLERIAPSVMFRPVEVLSDKHNFFCESSYQSGIWARDKFNLVDDVRNHYVALLKRKGVVDCFSHFDLNLAVGFDISTPNNTLKAFWTNHGSWKPLLKR